MGHRGVLFEAGSPFRGFLLRRKANGTEIWLLGHHLFASRQPRCSCWGFSLLGALDIDVDPVFPHSAESNIAYAVSSLLGGISKGLQTFLVISTAMTIASISE